MEIANLYSLNPVYPIFVFLIAVIFIFLSFKIGKWVFRILAFLALILAFLMIFVF